MVCKRTFFIVLKHIHHTIHTGHSESYCFQNIMCIQRCVCVFKTMTIFLLLNSDALQVSQLSGNSMVQFSQI